MKLPEAFKTRWSPRAFEDKPITNDQVNALFEAAQWAPSSMNEQPWRYYYAMKNDTEAFRQFVDCLVPGNQAWAQNAGMLIISVAKKHFDYKNRPNAYALHDTGAANSYLALAATAQGLQAHQMGGFDKSKVIGLLNLDAEKYEPATVIAIGYEGDASILPEDLMKREQAPRTRLNIEEIVQRIDK
ncbi:nitroreductase family protein [Carboxylicivirga sp. RSCT41]|uniref:nitroreductase family protein n=1 Tax=Carboxylicivirga agarovorans TaxID=3417570 RepID=UPI003D33701A